MLLENLDIGKATTLPIDSESAAPFGAMGFSAWKKDSGVVFDVNFANDAIAVITEVSFDVGNFGDLDDVAIPLDEPINVVELRIWDGAVELTTPGQFIKSFDSGIPLDPWTPSSVTSFDVSGLNIASTAGSVDDYRFAIYAGDEDRALITFDEESALVIDNMRLSGIPEPTAFSLIGSAGILLILRRRRFLR